jgi:hypothetical protein
MRRIGDYTAKEWLKFDPIKYGLKEARNRFVQLIYNRVGSLGVEATIDMLAKNHKDILVMAILFETPWIADWLCRSVKKNLVNADLVLFDNSRTVAARIKNKEICEAYHVSYVALPRLPIWNVNWSHSSAMQWIFFNFVRILKPNKFAFIDHDMIPFDRVDLAACVDSQPFYGLLRPGGRNEKFLGAWSLWAGFCVFNYKYLEYQDLDFLYNFSMGLDTGGGNYELLYKKFSKEDMLFSPVYEQSINIPNQRVMDGLQVIDGKWIHVGSVSYGGTDKKKQDYWRGLDAALTSGIGWDSILVSSQRTW